MQHLGDILFTDAVRRFQEADGSAAHYEKHLTSDPRTGLGAGERQFIADRESFYIASNSASGFPYVQHRGGPRGFLKVLSPTTLGFADYRGNRQFISTGNLETDDRVSLFLMDYGNKRRLKMLGHAKTENADDSVHLEAVRIDGEGPVQRVYTVELTAIEWNCPKYIPDFYAAEVVQATIKPQFEQLRSENAALKAEIARLKETI